MYILRRLQNGNGRHLPELRRRVAAAPAAPEKVISLAESDGETGMSKQIALATEDDEIQSCYPVMVELRPHVQPDEFLERVKRQMEIAGFRLAYLRDGEVKAVAGFRISECLASGKYLYVDDLVAKSEDR